MISFSGVRRLGPGVHLLLPERLDMAGTHGKAETINFDKEEVYERLNAMTQGRGPDRCIDAVGCEAHGTGGVDAVLDNVKAGVKLATDRAHVIRQAIFCCRKGGTVSVPGVYVGLIDQMPFGAAVNKGLTIKTGQTHVQRYGKSLLEKNKRRSNRSVIHHHSSPSTRGSTSRLQDLSRQGRWVH